MSPATSIEQIREAIGATCAGPATGMVAGVSTDTRTLQPGDLFIALRGERFDGHRFIAEAAAAGAAAVVVEELPDPAPVPPVLHIRDTLLALQRLARWHRERLDLAVVGITGSNGKTITKDFAAGALGRRLQVTATRGNLNNHIGLPLCVLAAGADDHAAVWEFGMNHPGEIAPLCRIALPRIGIITNIGTAHIEFLGSREGIAEEKGALARALPADGTLVVPAGCDFVEYFRARTHARVLPVGNGRGQVRAERLVIEGDRTRFLLAIDGHEPAPVELAVCGRHMVTNALLAAAAAWSLGLEPAETAAGLAAARLAAGRLTRLERRGIAILDDSYNANPESMAAALDTLAESPVVNGGRRIAVLGHMGELGAFAEEAHQRVGRLAAERGVQVAAVGAGTRAILDGVAAAGGAGEQFTDHAEAAGWLARTANPGDLVLFKGSRSAAIEQVLELAFPADSD